MPLRHLTVHDAEPEIETSRFSAVLRVPAVEAGSKFCNKLFEEVDHHDFSLHGAVTKTVTSARGKVGRKKEEPGESGLLTCS